MKVLYFDESKLPTKNIDISKKDQLINFYTMNMLNRTQAMFEWKNLPETIPQRALEMTIQRGGSTNIFEWEGKLYQSFGALSGKLDYNYMPAMVIVANPYIKNFASKTMRVYRGKDYVYAEQDIPYDIDCVIIPNDALYLGIMPIISVYSAQLAENTISKRMVTINARAMNICIAPDQNAKNDFKEFLSKLEEGELSAILAKNLMADMKALPFAESKSHGILTDLIEDHQYIKASLYNDLGLNANYNMKRESLNSNESQLNQDALLPLCDQMLYHRKEACKLINERFGVNWEVDFSSAWKAKRVQIEEATDAIDDTSSIVDNEEVEVVHQDGKGEENGE